eukprot:4566784-Pleurochrysis_carterae.AAC.1
MLALTARLCRKWNCTLQVQQTTRPTTAEESSSVDRSSETRNHHHLEELPSQTPSVTSQNPLSPARRAQLVAELELHRVAHVHAQLAPARNHLKTHGAAGSKTFVCEAGELSHTARKTRCAICAIDFAFVKRPRRDHTAELSARGSGTRTKAQTTR